MAEMKTIEVYVADGDVKEHFGIYRGNSADDNEYQERCDNTDMTPYDKDIAALTGKDWRLELSTTADRWNVYLVIRRAEMTYEVVNVTDEARRWDSVLDVVEYLINAYKTLEVE